MQRHTWYIWHDRNATYQEQMLWRGIRKTLQLSVETVKYVEFETHQEKAEFEEKLKNDEWTKYSEPTFNLRTSLLSVWDKYQ